MTMPKWHEVMRPVLETLSDGRVHTVPESVRKHAAIQEVSISDYRREAVFEKIEDGQDLADLRAAVAADDGQRLSLTDVRSELGL